MFRFEKLEVWHLAKSFANEIYEKTDSFPKAEEFGLKNQLRRASVSIAANIAEGSSRTTNKDYSRFITIAFGSLCEVIAELSIALDRNFIDKKSFDELYLKSEKLAAKLSAFKNKLDETV